MPEANKELVEAWFGLEPNHDAEARILYEFSKMFEDFLLDTDNDKSAMDYVALLRSRVQASEIYNRHILRNQALFAKAHEKLIGMNLQHNPEVRRNARYVIKVAHNIYPGTEFETARQFVIEQVRRTFDTSEGSSSNPRQHEMLQLLRYKNP